MSNIEIMLSYALGPAWLQFVGNFIENHAYVPLVVSPAAPSGAAGFS